MDKGFVHNLAESLPQRQANAKARYEKEARVFYKGLEDKGINTDASKVADNPTWSVMDTVANNVKRYKTHKERMIENEA